MILRASPGTNPTLCFWTAEQCQAPLSYAGIAAVSLGSARLRLARLLSWGEGSRKMSCRVDTCSLQVFECIFWETLLPETQAWGWLLGS